MTARQTKNLLITGAPGVGKTTLVQKLADELAQHHPVGFFTEEIRERGIRKGFTLISLDGREGVLSHIDIKSPCRVSRYGVDVEGFEAFLDTIDFLSPATSLVVIDEIGKMECYSDRFRNLLSDILASDKTVIASIALKGDQQITAIKKRPDTTLITVTRQNRDNIVSEIASRIS